MRLAEADLGADLERIFGERGKDILRRYVEALVATLPVEEIWVFGSCARGAARWDSDLDLLLVLSDDHGLVRPNLKCYQAINRLPGRPPTDVVAVSKSGWLAEQADPFGVYGEAFREGVRIYAKQSS